MGRVSISKVYKLHIDLWPFSPIYAAAIADKLFEEFKDKADDVNSYINPMESDDKEVCEACVRRYNSLKNLGSLRKDGY